MLLNRINQTLSIAFFSFILLSNVGFAQKSKERTPSKFEYEGPLYNGRGRVMQKVKKVPMWGFIDKTGNIVIGMKYNEVENFKEGMAKVRKGHFWGLVDTTGKEIVPIAFDWISDFEGDRAKVMSKGEKAYINRSGVIVGR